MNYSIYSMKYLINKFILYGRSTHIGISAMHQQLYTSSSLRRIDAQTNEIGYLLSFTSTILHQRIINW